MNSSAYPKASATHKAPNASTSCVIAKFPKIKKVGCDHIICSVRIQKSETYRTIMKIRGDTLDNDGSTKAPKAELTTIKLFLNIVLRTLGAKVMTIDIKKNI